MTLTDAATRQKRETFFLAVYGQSDGFVCVAKIPATHKGYEEEYFKYPEELDKLLNWVETSLSHNLYFCPNILEGRKRSKEFVKACPTAYADLDECPPDRLLVEPSVTLESSPGRYQALWIMTDDDPSTVEDISRRIAYKHSDDGADKSGWDLTQLLRIPFTYNYKYGKQVNVRIHKATGAHFDVDAFKTYEPIDAAEDAAAAWPPKLPDATAEDILRKYRTDFHPRVWNLYQEVPNADWSKNLWQLELLLYEAGLSPEEVFVITREAKCNKYKRDNRSERLLWREVCRARNSSIKNGQVVLGPSFDIEALPPLLDPEEREAAEADVTIIDDYVAWARSLGDAAWQYHQAGAFVILSSLLSGNIRLPTRYGIIVPNLWFMILADTTLTRKSTAMDVAIELLLDIDPDCVLATDGSIEGLMTSLSMRPNKSSVFLRDEFSGMLDAMAKKDYYAGMGETLTKLYDGKFQKRVLRRETIEVRDPVLIMFTGGIKSRILELLSYEHVSSGFIPRFVFIAAEADVSRLEPLGPPTPDSLAGRDALLKRFSELASKYKGTHTVTVEGKAIEQVKKFNATLTPEAWARYNRAESELLAIGMKSMQKELLTPTFDRLAKSTLKCAVLIAASRAGEQVLVTEQDFIKALWFSEQWYSFSLEVIRNVGKTASEKQLDLILNAIKRHPGISRGQIMQYYHLNARNAEEILGTLEQRGQVSRVKKGRGENLHPVEV